MPGETEVERLVVRMVFDNQQQIEALKASAKGFEENERKIRKEAEVTEETMKRGMAEMEAHDAMRRRIWEKRLVLIEEEKQKEKEAAEAKLEDPAVTAYRNRAARGVFANQDVKDSSKSGMAAEELEAMNEAALEKEQALRDKAFEKQQKLDDAAYKRRRADREREAAEQEAFEAANIEKTKKQQMEHEDWLSKLRSDKGREQDGLAEQEGKAELDNLAKSRKGREEHEDWLNRLRGDSFAKQETMAKESWEGAEKENQMLLDRGEQIQRSVMTKKERRIAREKELNSLLKAGAIDQQTYDRASKAGEQAGGEGLAGMGMRGTRQVGRAGIHFAVAQSAQQEAQALSTAAFAVGAAFGPMGIVVASSLDAIMSKVDRAAQSANKGFMSMLDGAKTFEQGMAEVKLTSFTHEIDLMLEKMNPETGWGHLMKTGKNAFQDIKEIVQGTSFSWDKGLTIDAKGFTNQAQRDQKQFEEAVERSKEAKTKWEGFMKSRAGKSVLQEAAQDNAAKVIADYNKAADVAGLLTYQVRAYELGLRGVSEQQQIVTSQLGRFSEAMTAVGQASLSLRKKGMGFMLTPEEASIRELEAAMAKIADPAKKDKAANDIAELQGRRRTTQQQELTKAMLEYTMSLEGASKAQIAMAMAAEGGMNKQMVYQIDLLKQAAAVTEQYLLPQDKYAKEQRRLDLLMKEGLITQQTYNRALGAAQKDLLAVQKPGNAALFGSAEARSRMEAQREMTKPVFRLGLDSRTSEEPGNAKAAQVTRERMAVLLEEIKAALAKEAKKPDVAPVKIGQGIGLKN